MSEKMIGGLEDRSQKGEEIYVESMEKSADDKEKIFPYVKEGIIVDMGAGAGPVTERLLARFPGSKIVAADISFGMIKRLEKRFSGNLDVEIIRADARNFEYPKPVDTIIHISNIHEIFSANKYNHEEIIKTLSNDLERLKKGGRLIIRDGVQPEPETLYLKPLTNFACDRFLKFVEGFGKVRRVNYMIGRFQSDVFIQSGRRTFTDSDIGNSLIEISSQNASEMFSKYFYPEENLPVELSEQFGIWTLREYQKILLSLGFAIVHSETYVLPYLVDNHYSKDFEAYHLVDGVLSNAPYPPSTMILVGEK
jgi:SAM-dependent methyltransferase